MSDWFEHFEGQTALEQFLKKDSLLVEVLYILREICIKPLYSETPPPSKGVIHIGNSRFGTTGHVWYRRDSGIAEILL